MTTDKKEFAKELEDIIRMIESGQCKFHSFSACPISCTVKEKNSTEFKRFYAVEFSLKVMTDREI